MHQVCTFLTPDGMVMFTLKRRSMVQAQACRAQTQAGSVGEVKALTTKDREISDWPERQGGQGRCFSSCSQ